MKSSARYVATFAAGFLAAVFFYYLLIATRSTQQPAAPGRAARFKLRHYEAGIVVATQSVVGSLVVVTQVQLPLLNQPSSGIVGSSFLFDGLRPQDLPRMNPPRTVPGMTPPMPIPQAPSEFPK